ncbi:MAG: hypothetical protein KBF80_06935 [Flavobacteriales bacterium]|nr:hypothetical protein [Flavobacteriales bacterium]
MGKLLATISLLLICYNSFGQSDSLKNKYLSIGSRTSGICFGNSSNYNGLRFNLLDNETERINGINISFLAMTEKTNGVQIGGLAAHTTRINGLSLAPVWQNSEKSNGLGVSFGIDSDTLNGVFAGFAVAPPNANIDNRVINGLAMGVFVGAEKVRGMAIGLFHIYSKKQVGLSVSAINRTDDLRGLQIGLLNYAGNNPKLLRWLPLINFHV